MAKSDNRPTWWGDFKIPENESMFWKIGALSLWIERKPWEWRIAHASTNDPNDDSLNLEGSSKAIFPTKQDGAELKRYALKKTSESIKLTPILPDRSIVARPEAPFHIIAQEETVIHISSPLWVNIELTSPMRELFALPIYRLSDTWFGPNNQEGELCYANRTTCRHDVQGLAPRPHRATTQVRIKNRTSEAILLEKFNLPLPHLSVWEGKNGAAWTQTVSIEIAREGETAQISIGKKPADVIDSPKLLSGPRKDEKVFIKALSALIG